MNLNHGLLEHIFKSNPSLDVSTQALIMYCCLFAVLLAAYLLGSVNTAIVVSRILYHEDVRTKGSGNAGLTNMLRVYGKRAAVLTLIGDIMKTVVAITIGGVIFGFGYAGAISTNYVLYLTGLLAVLGHVFPCYYRFKGGKGVLVTSTMALILTPLIFAGLLVLFVIVVALWKYVSLGSITVAVLYPIALNFHFRFVFGGPIHGMIALCAILLACLIVWCHRENLKRISNRTESKLSFKKKSNDENS